MCMQAERQDVEWRLHWLELRLRELAYQRARHEEAYAQLCGAATDAEATAELGDSCREAAAAQQYSQPPAGFEAMQATRPPHSSPAGAAEEKLG